MKYTLDVASDGWASIDNVLDAGISRAMRLYNIDSFHHVILCQRLGRLISELDHLELEYTQTDEDFDDFGYIIKSTNGIRLKYFRFSVDGEVYVNYDAAHHTWCHIDGQSSKGILLNMLETQVNPHLEEIFINEDFDEGLEFGDIGDVESVKLGLIRKNLPRLCRLSIMRYDRQPIRMLHVAESGCVDLALTDVNQLCACVAILNVITPSPVAIKMRLHPSLYRYEGTLAEMICLPCFEPFVHLVVEIGVMTSSEVLS